MFSSHANVWNYLRTGIKFDTYSDAKLAGLFLENEHNFPVQLLAKVFDVILDPDFKLEEVSFKSFWDVLERISGIRARDAVVIASKGITPAPALPTNRAEDARSSGIPAVVLSHVVDMMVEDRPPLGIAAMDWWKLAYWKNVADFNRMSLVHRSWTPIARRGLRRRVVIPYWQIRNFLVSPLCGPWITEMIVHWEVHNGMIGVTLEDIALFEALLERVPALRSLVFKTRLVWPRSSPYGADKPPPFRVDECLQLIANLPELENLWLKHAKGTVQWKSVMKHFENIKAEDTLELCPEMNNLCSQLPTMQSLKFLSIRLWTGLRKLENVVQPPSSLKSIELDNTPAADEDESDDPDRTYEYETIIKDDGKAKLLLEPGDEFNLSTLSIHVVDSDALTWGDEISCSFPTLTNLQLCFDESHPDLDIFQDCDQLVKLDLLFKSDSAVTFNELELPPTLQHLGFHFHEDTLEELLGSRGDSASDSEEEGTWEFIRSLPNLRYLTFTEALPQDQLEDGELDGFLYHMPHCVLEFENGLSRTLVELCDAHNVKLSVHYALCTTSCI